MSLRRSCLPRAAGSHWSLTCTGWCATGMSSHGSSAEINRNRLSLRERKTSYPPTWPSNSNRRHPLAEGYEEGDTLCCLDETDDQSNTSHQKNPKSFLSSPKEGTAIFPLESSPFPGRESRVFELEPWWGWNTRLSYPCWQTRLETSMVQLFFMFRLQLLTNILEQYIPQDDDALGEVAFPFICSKFTKQ